MMSMQASLSSFSKTHPRFVARRISSPVCIGHYYLRSQNHQTHAHKYISNSLRSDPIRCTPLYPRGPTTMTGSYSLYMPFCAVLKIPLLSTNIVSESSGHWVNVGQSRTRAHSFTISLHKDDEDEEDSKSKCGHQFRTIPSEC